MGVTVSLNIVTVCNFVFLSMVCAAMYFGMHRKPALAWMAAALLCGSVELLFLTFATSETVVVPTAIVLVPSAYLCIGQAVRFVIGSRHAHGWLIAIVGALSATSLLLLASGVPFLYQTIPFQLACSLALADSVFRLARHKNRSLLDTFLMLSISGTAAVFLIRVPLFSLLFDATSSYAEIATSKTQAILLSIAMLLAPPSIFLLLAKIIGGEIATYRTRSERDGLTGLLNRQAFDHAAEAEFRGGGAVVFCDIDHFKQVNDRYGHQAGDAIIRAFASILAGTGCRAGRLGGDEFVLLLPGKTAAEAAEVANAIRVTFARGVHSAMGADHRPSASFGVAAYGPGALPNSAFGRADTALYSAKKEGRNRVVIFAPGKGGEQTSSDRRRAA